MSDALDKYFKELAEAYADEFSTCSECENDYPDAEMNSDLAVRNGASLCDSCFAKIEEQSRREAPTQCAICHETFAASQLLSYSDIRDGAPVCLPCFAVEKNRQAGG